MKVTVIPIAIGALGTVTGRDENKRTNGDHLDYNFTEIGQYTEKCPEELRRLAVTQTLVENNHLTLVWKILK